MASLKRKRVKSSSGKRAANTVESLRADGSSRVQVGNSYTEVHNYEGRQADDECLRDLRTTDPRIDKTRIENEKGGLVQGSYHWVLENSKFRQWTQGTKGGFLWVKGDPGKGKTMLLCGLIDELKKSQHALSYFFCQATDSRINNAASVLRGLVYLLVVQDTSLTRHVRNKWDHGGKSTFDPPNGWHVLCNIFEDILHSHSKPACLVIDALDECEGSSLPYLLNLIVSMTPKFNHVKWLVSSRNLPDIERGLGGTNPSWRLDLSLEANADLVSRAVADYIVYKVDSLAMLSSETDLRKRVKETMQNKANGTFLWAALAFEELKAEQDEELEDNSEMLDILDQVPEGLTNLYDRMWRQIIAQGPRNSSSCKVILATMFLAYRPLQLQELPLLAGLKANLANLDTLIKLVRRCGSFLTIRQDAETVHFVHQSAKDFLADNKDAFDGMFPSGIGEGHYRLFSRSLEAMTTGLRQNIYGLRNPGVLTSEIQIPVPDPLAMMRYSCVRWLDHFRQWVSSKQDRGQDDAKDVTSFFQEQYLYWLEALGLCGGVIEGIVSIRKLEALATHNQWDHLVVLTRDARRFVLANRRGIEAAPLQVYVSALIFCPTSSWVQKRFDTMIPRWIKKKPTMQPEWDTCMLTLEGHDFEISTLAFSPDSRIVASSDRKGTIKIWDLYTGACVNTISGRYSKVFGLSWLSTESSTILASAGEGSDGYSIKIWDPFNGGPPRRTFAMPNKMSDVVTFTASNKTVVWVDKAGALIKLDLDTGAHLDTIKLPTQPIAVSPDGQTIITQKWAALQVWDWGNPETDRLTLHRRSPNVAVSLDSTKLVCACEGWKHGHSSMEVWDLTTGVRSTSLRVAAFLLASPFVFSPDGTVVAFRDFDNVNLWDTGSNTLQPLSGHSDVTSALAISSDGRLLASGCKDETIKIWDPTIGVPLNFDTGPNDGPQDWLLSPNGLWVASMMSPSCIRMWSSVTGEYAFDLCAPTLESPKGGIDPVCRLEFSPCDRWLAFWFAGRLTIWDTTTRTIQFELELLGSYRWGSCFSLSGNLARTFGETIEIWDLHTGKLKSTLSSSLPGYVKRTSFSPNGLWLALASWQALEIWDWAAKERIWVLNEGPGKVYWDLAHDALLCTSCGNFCVQGSTGDYSIVAVQIQGEEDKDQVQITHDGEWVTVQGKRVLWVPPQYRPRFKVGQYGGKAVDSNRSGIAILDNYNRVIYVQLDIPEIVLKF